MVDYAKVKEALDQSIEETRRYLRAQGAATERARIVAWLRLEAEICNLGYRVILQALAREIERGDHAQPDPARREDGE